MTANMHRRTPALAVIDARGLPVREVAYLRAVADDTPTALTTRQQHDVAGRLVEQWDPRLCVPCLVSVHSLDGSVLKSDSVDAGWRLSLPGLGGEPLQRWDQRGTRWRTTFDRQLRVIALAENDEIDVDVFTYADASADAAHNLRGQLLAQKDRSGTLRTGSFALTGQALTQTRTFEDGEAFTSHWLFSPLGAVLEQIDAGGHRQRSRFGLAGQIKQMHLRINGKTDWQPVLLDVQYNAAEQIIEQLAGNHVRNRWTYHLADGRLHTQSSRKEAGEVLQDFEYFHDRVGNIDRIEDHAFQPVYFANQFVDGHRDFSYDSLYRLTRATGYDDAPPPDIPGLSQPSDPNNRLNYTQTYQYDRGGNLVELCHVRAGNNYTRTMRIDPQSNRAVQWKPEDPEPVFDKLFDSHGNQQALLPGQNLQWNTRDELQQVTLILRDNQRSDVEHYAYSQGSRVFKHHKTFNDTAEHFQQVRYLPGLEIRTRDNGEALHVISVGGVRCLHWAQRKPKGVDDDQLRYSLDDHLGSCVMELDQQGDLISHEGYYPFGATAWMRKYPANGIDYKTVRYSGKELDVSGLYYYGARYYAPWLQRWVSADPAGDVDGLNLYGFVGNNPILYIDNDGTQKDTPSNDRKDIADYSKVLDNLGVELQTINRQLNGMFSSADIGKRVATNTGFNIAKGALTTGAGAAGATIGSVIPIVGTIIVGTLASKAAGAAMDKLGEYTTTSTPVLPDTQKLNPKSIYSNATVGFFTPLQYAKKVVKSYNPMTSAGRQKLAETAAEKALSKIAGIPAASEMMAIGHSGIDAAKALAGMRDIEIDDLRTALVLITEMLEQDRSDVNAAFSSLGINEFYDEGVMGSVGFIVDLAKGNVGTRDAMSISRERIMNGISVRLAEARRGIELIGKYSQYNKQKAA
jgi:insecticidal toxin complex protein TccC